MKARLLPDALGLFLAISASGCFTPAQMAKMQEQAGTYSMSPNFDLSRRWSIAVLPPTAGMASVATEPLYDHAGLALMRTTKVVLVDRTEVDRILQEQQFSASGAVDPGTATRLGRLMGAEAVMLVNVNSVKHDEFFSDSPEQRDAKLYVKIIRVETGEVLYYSQGEASSFEGADEAMQAALDVAMNPMVVKGVQQR